MSERAKLDPRVERVIIDCLSRTAADAGAALAADFVVMLACQGDNVFAVVQLAHDFRARAAALSDDTWRRLTVKELRDYADAIESGRVNLGSYHVVNYYDDDSGPKH